MTVTDRWSRWIVLGVLAAGLTACSSPPSAPTLTMSFGLKQFELNWLAVADADYYRLLANLDGSAGFSQIGSNLSAETTSTTVSIAVHLYPWEVARYALEA